MKQTFPKLISYKTVIAASVIFSFVLLCYWSWFTFFAWLALHVGVGFLAVFHGAGLMLCRGNFYKPPVHPAWIQSVFGKYVLKWAESLPHSTRFGQSSSLPQRRWPAMPDAAPRGSVDSGAPARVVVSRNVDVVLSEFFELLSRDFLLSWLSDLSHDPHYLVSAAQRLYWDAASNLSERLAAIDAVRLISTDLMNLLNQHFVDIRRASRCGDGNVRKKTTPFKLKPYLESPSHEIDFLRKVCDCVLHILLPEDEREDEILRGLLKEILAFDLIYPTVNSVCDPDYINQFFLNWVEYRESVATAQKRTYAYAKNYEEFIRMINESDDVEQLKQIRYQVMTEIMQAATIKRLKSIEKQSGDKMPRERQEEPTGRQTKGELLKSRNLKRYINQCTIAKSVAEKRLRVIGGQDYARYGAEEEKSDEILSIPGKKVLSFGVIMESSGARAAFGKYLLREEVASLLWFWEGVEFRMKEITELPSNESVAEMHHLATELYQRYINAVQNVVKLNKSTIAGMHAFLLGDAGPEAFETTKSVIGRALEEKFYPSFLVSDIYYGFVSQLSEDLKENQRQSADEEKLDNENSGSAFSLLDLEENQAPALKEHSTYAQKKLTAISDKILNKSSALDALRAAHRPVTVPGLTASGFNGNSNSKQHRLIGQLERDLEVLQAERRQLEAFIERTDNWLEHVGQWRITVAQSSNIEEGGKTVPYFVLLVHLLSHSSSLADGAKSSDTHGFVVTRRLGDFLSLHKKLHPLRHHVSENLKLPSPGIFDKDTSDKFLSGAMAKLQTYVDVVTADPILCQSEAIYAFCCPTPEFLSREGGKSKSTQISAAFDGFSGAESVARDDPPEKNTFDGIKRAFSKKTEAEQQIEDTHEFLIQDDNLSYDRKLADSFAEPIYNLVAEIFELRGVFKIFRQSLITFVRVTFGKSINKQLHEFIHWLFCDDMVVYYLTLLKGSMWLTDGRLAPAPTPRTDDEKHECRRKCKLKLVKNIPDALTHLLGQQTTQQGIIKIFESFQDVRLNKQLFYSIFELLVFEVFPELKDID